MALHVETGAGIANANSYLTVDMADTLFADRGVETWAEFSPEEKEIKLTNAARALEVKYRGKWFGYKATSTQRMAWPRAKTYLGTDTLTDPDGAPIPVNLIPEPVKDAQLEIVMIDMNGGDFNSAPLTRDDRVKREKVDVLETEWFANAPASTLYPLLDQILFGYAMGAVSGVPIMAFNLLLSAEEAAQGSDYDPYSDPAYFNQG